METRSASFVAGARAVAPIMLGMLPFALICGTVSVANGVSPARAVAFSGSVFAGAAQLAALNLLGQNAPLAIIVLTGLVINLRLAMYSASLAPHFASLPGRWKGLIAFFLTDQTFALSIARFAREADGREQGRVDRRWFFLGTGTLLWSMWVLATGAGAVLGAALPDGLGLDFAVPLTFIVLAVPVLRDTPALAAAAAAAFVAVAAHALPYNSWLLAAAVLGIATGTATEAFMRRKQ